MSARCPLALWPMRALGRLLLVPILVTLQQPFPDDRSLCDTQDLACTVGNAEIALDYVTRTVTKPPSVDVGELGVLDPGTDRAYLLPPGVVIDYVGTHVRSPAPYERPETYLDEDDVTVSAILDNTIYIDDGAFIPAHLSVLTGSTVRWVMRQFEEVRIVGSSDRNHSIGSGRLNYNTPPFTRLFTESSEYMFYNAALEPWQGRFSGRLTVRDHNCSSYKSCTTCLIYDACIWCSGSGTCVGLNQTTNIPDDTGVVSAIPLDPNNPIRQYNMIKYMRGFNAFLGTYGFNWYPWPPVRANNPRPANEKYIPSFFDPVESDSCLAYKRDREVTTCSDYVFPPPLARVLGKESAGRPKLDDVLECFAHLQFTWTVPHNPAPPNQKPVSNTATSRSGWTGIVRGSGVAGEARGVSASEDGRPNQALSPNPGRQLAADEDNPQAMTGQDAADTEPPDSDQSSPLEDSYVPFGATFASPSSDHAGNELSHRKLQVLGLGAVASGTVWDLVPFWQQKLVPGLTIENFNDVDVWATVKTALERIYGPSVCNATHGCDPLRGRCLNISGMPVYAYDQNGTCVCSAWHEGPECTEVILNSETCRGFSSTEKCRVIRDALYSCGPVEELDALPRVCIENGLTIFECGQAGHLLGTSADMGTPNLIGAPQPGYAAMTCSRWLGRRDGSAARQEVLTKLCRRSEVLAACARHESAVSQRVCNYCAGDTQGSVMPQRGTQKGCSFFRGTCMGSVERRIRGIVPPNSDIVGQTKYGGLRYCKQEATFTSEQHFYTNEDIMQPGQACIDNQKVWTNWDFSKQRDHPDTVKDRQGRRCLDPEDPATCPPSRLCVEAKYLKVASCPTDKPDWQDIDELIKWWGRTTLESFADPAPPGVPRTFTQHQVILDPKTAYLRANWKYMTPEALEATSVDWGLASSSDA